MTIRKAKRLIEVLTASIHDLEDEAVANWERPEDFAQEYKNHSLHEQLTAKYTCRRALKSWLARHTQ